MAGSRRRIFVACGAWAVASAVAIALGTLWPATGSSLPRADRVVVFGLPFVKPADVTRAHAPVLARLRARAGSAVLSARAGTARPTVAEGYTAFGASARARRTPAAAAAVDDRARGGVAVLDPVAVRRASRRAHLSSLPGALGSALHAAGRRTAVVGNADDPDARVPEREFNRPAAVALMDARGRVDAGSVERTLLRPGATLAAARRAIRTADVVLVDPGDLERAEDGSERARLRALARSDRLLGALAAGLPPHTLLIVASVSPAPSGRVTPLVVSGPGVEDGALVSGSTKRRGIVALSDLAPTVLAVLGIGRPRGMTGHPIEDDGRPIALSDLVAEDRDTAVRSRLFGPSVAMHSVLFAALLALVAAALSPRPGRRWGVVAWAALAVAAFPLTTYLIRAIPGVAKLGPTANGAILLALTAAVSALALRARGHPLAPLAWVLGATVVVIVADTLSGTHLHEASVLGFSLAGGGRFYGLPNTTFAVLGSATLLVAAIAIQQRPQALPFVAAGMAFVVVVDGAPGLGSDVGGLLTLAPVCGLMVLALSGRRLTWRALAVAAAAALVLLVVAAGLDLLRPAEQRTHLGQFASDVLHDGPGVITDTIERKESANLRLLLISPWTPLVPMVLALPLLVLGARRRRDRLLPPGSPLRIGVAATAVFALAGFLVNDSGAVVIALALAYLGPLLALLAMADRGPPSEPPEKAPATHQTPAIVGGAWRNDTS